MTAVQGQWEGRFQGTNNGALLVDIDERSNLLVGRAYAFDDGGLPGIMMPFEFAVGTAQQTLNLPITLLHPTQARVLPITEARQLFPQAQFPQMANVTLRFGQRTLRVTWTTPIGTNGTATLHHSKAARPSTYRGERGVRTWAQFKKFVLGLEPNRFIFRGQSRAYRLRTAFHRTNRKDMLAYLNEDVPMLHRMLSSRTRHLFNLRDGIENAAFLNLIQHHGFPTPLLDWSYSPFVAAFFAYATSTSPTSSQKVRIFMFDRKAWLGRYNQLHVLGLSRPHFSILEALAIENERAIPQQALLTVTNLDDIESYVQTRETEQQYRFLKVFDLLTSEKPVVERELRLMGITSASLFPGLDGTCAELRRQRFE
jgi:hypothetical protein